MKELSIEEKAKRYDKAIKVAQRFYNNSVAITKKGLEDIFPKLKESEDEEIKEMLKVAVERTPWMQDKKEKCYEWLEAQGEQKPVDDLTQQEAMDIAVAKCFEWGEQKPTKVEPKFKVGQTIKKEGFNLGFTIVKIKNGFYYNNVGDHFPFTDQDNWELVEQNPADEVGNYDHKKVLQTIVNEQKPAWSEEDEKMAEGCKNAIVFELTDNAMDDELNTDPRFNWLKSIKDRVQPQNTWKPSDEQIKAIRLARSFVTDDFDEHPALSEILIELEKQLKKLREE